ncbi:MAG TPA: DUF4212 domain-containing protein [Noviherbaspirillum sp.]|uniref:DUF4212 domain-containing protein n=1 Tax=Noviherbaspirillum sp. TaxID=1926288 RepID=UPI002D677B82|nr:DUF4212 domain-containing protein [Noviherbaspirillum sp.]HYD94426.1 DUF4212 domain-containing protein [Noviherbaspirillum sp.]
MDTIAARNRKRYWRKAKVLTAFLVSVWFSTTFGIIFFARELAGLTLFGWPFSFYMAAQGLSLLYLLIVAVYVARMRRLDRILNNETADAE